MRVVNDVVRPKSRRCPQCGGNMFFYTDLDNWYAECVKCSYKYDLKSIAGSEEAPPPAEEGANQENKP